MSHRDLRDPPQPMIGPADLSPGDKWVSKVGSSSFEVESIDPIVVHVTRQVTERGGTTKVEKRRRELLPQDVGFFALAYRKL